MKSYEVAFEIAGPMAMFARPDTGDSIVSYPVPPSSAAAGMFDCVAWLKTACIRPTRVQVCSPIRYRNYTTNYNGPLRNSVQRRKLSAYQLVAVVLEDVCYQVFGSVVELSQPPKNKHGRPFNHAHYLQEKFARRLASGVLHHTPCLGWKEFVPNYFGPLRSASAPVTEHTEYIPSLLAGMYDSPSFGKVAPQFKPAWIREGVLDYAE